MVAWGIGSSLAAAVVDMSDSGELVRESCMREACRHCRACAAGQRVLAHGCLPASQQGCRHRRHSRRRTRVRARSGRPGVMLEDDGDQLVACLGRTWMRFFPSGLVTRGCNFGVVNVYTSPVSDTTSSKTWVPVRTESSYA